MVLLIGSTGMLHQIMHVVQCHSEDAAIFATKLLTRMVTSNAWAAGLAGLSMRPFRPAGRPSPFLSPTGSTVACRWVAH